MGVPDVLNVMATRSGDAPMNGLSRGEKNALAPFLRCLGVTPDHRWTLIRDEIARLGLDDFVALHTAFRRYMLFSDVYLRRPHTPPPPADAQKEET